MRRKVAVEHVAVVASLVRIGWPAGRAIRKKLKAAEKVGRSTAASSFSSAAASRVG